MRIYGGIAVVVFLAAAAGLASAATINVPKDHLTIQGAVDAASAGDTIIVKKNTYGEAVVIQTSGIKLLGKGKPVIDGGGVRVPLSLIGCRDVEIVGFVIDDSNDDGIFLEDCSDILITKCLIKNTDNSGILAESCDRLTIIKNKFDNIDEDGVALSDDAVGSSTDDCLIEKNKFKNTGDDAVDLTGDRNRIVKNRISLSNGDGIDLDDGVGNTIEANKIKKTQFDEIVVEAQSTAVFRNKITRPQGDGIWVTSTGNKLEGNKIKKAGDDGIDLDSGSNTLTNNKASKSSDVDLEVSVSPDTNSYSGNKFKTTDPAGAGG